MFPVSLLAERGEAGERGAGGPHVGLCFGVDYDGADALFKFAQQEGRRIDAT
jgi:hypothetical protein